MDEITDGPFEGGHMMSFDKDDDAYSLPRELVLAGALWPESFSGVGTRVEDRGITFTPLLRFNEDELDLSRWPVRSDETNLRVILACGAFDHPEIAEAIVVFLFSWDDIDAEYRFGFNLRTSIRRLFFSLPEADYKLMITDSPKGSLGGTTVVGDLGDTSEINAIVSLARHIEMERKDLWLPHRNCAPEMSSRESGGTDT